VKNVKTTKTAYAFWAILGVFGAHRFYLRRPIWTAVLQLILFLPFLVWLPHFIAGMDQALAAGMSMDPSNPDALSSVAASVPSMGMGWLQWPFCANQIWWLIDAALIPAWVRQCNGDLIPRKR